MDTIAVLLNGKRLATGAVFEADTDEGWVDLLDETKLKNQLNNAAENILEQTLPIAIETPTIRKYGVVEFLRKRDRVIEELQEEGQKLGMYKEPSGK